MSREDFSTYSRKLLQGLGLGEGIAYKPWYTAPKSGTLGVAPQIFGLKTGRIHHGLSTHEKSLYFLLEFDSNVVDIREQFPLLPLSLAMRNAELLDIKYPIIRGTKTPSVLTTDFLVTYSSNRKLKYKAFSVKPRKGLVSKRDFEKQELERIWWESLGIPWQIFLDDEDDRIASNNVCWLSQPMRAGTRFKQEELISILNVVEPGIYELDYLVMMMAQKTNKSPEMSKNIFRTLAWNQYIQLDLRVGLLTDGIINILSKKHMNETGNVYGIAAR